MERRENERKKREHSEREEGKKEQEKGCSLIIVKHFPHLFFVSVLTLYDETFPHLEGEVEIFLHVSFIVQQLSQTTS